MIIDIFTTIYVVEIAAVGRTRLEKSVASSIVNLEQESGLLHVPHTVEKERCLGHCFYWHTSLRISIIYSSLLPFLLKNSCTPRDARMKIRETRRLFCSK